MRTGPWSAPRHPPGLSQDFSGVSGSPKCGRDPSKLPGALQGCHGLPWVSTESLSVPQYFAELSRGFVG